MHYSRPITFHVGVRGGVRLDEASSPPSGQEGVPGITIDESWRSVRRVLASTDLVWRCARCGYQRQQRVRPPSCPDCGAESDEFVGRTSLEWRGATPPGTTPHPPRRPPPPRP